MGRYKIAVIAVLLFSSEAVAQEVPLDSVAGWQTRNSGRTYSFAWGDVDGDGDLDLASGGYAVSVFYNRDGTLEELESWSVREVSGWTVNVAWGDVDGDGDLDLACGGVQNLVYINHDGVLEDSASWRARDSVPTRCVAWGDVDNDGDLDLASGNLFSLVSAYGGPNSIYFNNGGVLEELPGWFAEDTVYTLSLAWGDMDNDGDLDLACGTSAGRPCLIYRNNGGVLERSASWQSLDSVTTQAVAWGDINGDGYPELVCGNSPAANKVYLNIGSTLIPVAIWESVGSLITSSIALGDVDNDGDLDLVCGNSSRNEIYINNDGNLDTLASWSSQEEDATTTVAWGDVDGDGDLDLACGTSEGIFAPSRMYFNNGYCLEKTASWQSKPAGGWGCVAWGDVDNDGDLDLACGDDHGVNVLYLSSDGVLETEHVWYSQDPDWTNDMAWGDVNNDGYQDLACANSYGDPSRVYMSRNGLLEDSASWFSEEANDVFSVAWGDVDNDGDLDLACGTDYNKPNRIYINSNGVLETTASWQSDDLAASFVVEWVDVDGDGDLDLACANSLTTAGIYFNNNGTLETSPGWLSESFDQSSSIGWGDVDGDGDLDLACANTSYRPNRVFMNNDGVMEVVSSWYSTEGDNSMGVAWGDVDCDGDLDLAFGNSDEPHKLYFNSNGILETMAGWSSDDSVSTWNMAWADADSDGDPDLAFGNQGGCEVHFNRRHECPYEANLVNNPSCLSGLAKAGWDSSTYRLDVAFDLTDYESDDCKVEIEYSLSGGGLWQPSTILEDLSSLATSPSGINYEVTWDADADAVDGYDVWLRLKATSNPDRAGIIQWPTQNYQLQIGRIDGRPKVALLYPRQNCVTAGSLPVLGRIWDATNFDEYEILIAELPDTAVWENLHSSSIPIIQTAHIATLDVGGMEAGDYILRTTATDNHGNSRTTDRYIEIAARPSGAPSILHGHPPPGAANVPGNAPVVVAFDQDMNQPSIDNETFNLLSESGERYTDALYEYNSRTLTIKPERSYSVDEFHFAVVSSRLPSRQGIEIGGEFVSSFNTSPASPSADIDSLRPFRGQVQTPVSLDSLRIYFNQPSLHRYVTVFSLEGDTIVSDIVAGGWYPGAVSMSGLLPKTYYLIRISDDPSFNGESDYMSYFITEDVQIPLVVDHFPEDEAWLVGLDDEITVSFNKPINTFTVDSGSFYVSGPTGKISGLYDFSGDAATKVTFAPLENLLSNAEYAVVLTSHIQDNIGNPIDSMSWRFTTGLFDTVRYEGGIMTSGDLTLSFPYGTLESDAEIGIGAIPAGKLLFGPDLTFTGIAYDIEPAMGLRREAVLSIRVPDSTITEYGNLNQLKIYMYDTLAGDWEYLGGSADADYLSLSIDRLGRYGIFQYTGGEVVSDFVSSLTVIPRVISPRRGDVNSTLAVSYSISQPIEVVAKIYDTGGRLVTTLVSGQTSSIGENLMQWDGRRDDGSYATDGLYILVVEAGGQRAQKTFVILNK